MTGHLISGEKPRLLPFFFFFRLPIYYEKEEEKQEGEDKKEKENMHKRVSKTSLTAIFRKPACKVSL